jgi:hypothetical protein
MAALLGGSHSLMSAAGGELLVRHWAALGAPLAGNALKWLGGALTRGQVGKLDELMRARTPGIQAPMSGWANAAQTFQVSPIPRNLAKLAIASRSLSGAFNDAGIAVAPRALIDAVRPSAAQEGQGQP